MDTKKLGSRYGLVTLALGMLFSPNVDADPPTLQAQRTGRTAAKTDVIVIWGGDVNADRDNYRGPRYTNYNCGGARGMRTVDRINQYIAQDRKDNAAYMAATKSCVGALPFNTTTTPQGQPNRSCGNNPKAVHDQAITDANFCAGYTDTQRDVGSSDRINAPANGSDNTVSNDGNFFYAGHMGQGPLNPPNYTQEMTETQIQNYYIANNAPPPGCTKLITQNNEVLREQYLTNPANRTWAENYVETHTQVILACNRASTPANMIVWYMLSQPTARDIFIEGFSNMPHTGNNMPDGTGSNLILPGTCDPTTGGAAANQGGLDEFEADSMNLLRYLFGMHDQNQCVTYSRNFNAACVPYSDQGYFSNVMGGPRIIAHSMGAIAAQTYGLPVDATFGSTGGVCRRLINSQLPTYTEGTDRHAVNEGADTNCNLRNNNDPIPTLTALGALTQKVAALLPANRFSLASCQPLAEPSQKYTCGQTGPQNLCGINTNGAYPAQATAAGNANGRNAGTRSVYDHTLRGTPRTNANGTPPVQQYGWKDNTSYYDMTMPNWGMPVQANSKANYRWVYSFNNMCIFPTD
jgi:hypothetical protein